MQLTSRAKVSAYAVVGIYSIMLYVLNSAPTTTITRVGSMLPIVVASIFWVYDNFLWYRKWLLRFAHKPYVAGTWRGQLTSFRRDEQDKQISSVHDIVLVVRQTFLTVTITLLSEQSRSRSSAATIVQKQSGDYQLYYQYQNEPSMQYRDQGSQIHIGGSVIQVGGDKPNRLTGEYWTSRDTKGTYEVTLLGREVMNSFEESAAKEIA
jgi:hypothetical protein